MQLQHETDTVPEYRLPYAHLRLAIIDVLSDSDVTRRTLEVAKERLWREDPEDVAAVYDEVWLIRAETPWSDGSGSGTHGLRAERMRELRRPLSARTRRGLTLADIAEQAGLNVETLARMLEHHGYLETSPFGGRQSRRLVTAAAYVAHHGHNVDPSSIRSPRLDGSARAAPFPVFYAEHVSSILWTLGLDLIQQGVAAQPTKKGKLAFLLAEHGYLPDAEMARLAGYSRVGVARARTKAVSVRPEALAA